MASRRRRKSPSVLHRNNILIILHRNNIYNKFFLSFFKDPYYKDTLDNDRLIKNKNCEDFCSNLLKKKCQNCKHTSINDKIISNFNISGVLDIYKGVIRKIFADMSELKNSENIFSFEIELSSHEIKKLDLFTNSKSDAEALSIINDVSDIIKSLHLTKIAFHDNFFSFEMSIALFSLMIVLYILFLNQRYSVVLSIKKFHLITFLVLFSLSVINNHKYLYQVKK
jgi:hypothetical protein